MDPYEHSHKPWVVAIIILFIVGLIGGLIAGVTIVKKKDSTVTKTVQQTGVTIDNVVVAADQDLSGNIAQMKDVQTFVQLLNSAGMKDYLHNVGPYTVLLPQDGAFKSLDQKKLSKLGSSPDQSGVKQLVLTNIISGTYTSADLRVMAALNQPITTLSGQKLQLKTINGKLTLTDSFGNISTLTPIDAIASNGVIQNSSQVMIPKGLNLAPPVTD